MTSYTTTAVPVERSKEAIRQLLIKFGARGVQFAEDFHTGMINVRFAKDINGNLRTVNMTMQVPEPPKARRRSRYGVTKSDAQRREQMTRATYRALHYCLKSQFEAVDFGLISFEDLFLSHFEWILPNGQQTTVGAMLVPHLQDGSNFLPAPKGDGQIIDG